MSTRGSVLALGKCLACLEFMCKYPFVPFGQVWTPHVRLINPFLADGSLVVCAFQPGLRLCNWCCSSSPRQWTRRFSVFFLLFLCQIQWKKDSAPRVGFRHLEGERRGGGALVFLIQLLQECAEEGSRSVWCKGERPRLWNNYGFLIN